MSRVSFDIQVQLQLSDFRLEVDVQARSRTLGVFGPSGAGKTSLLEAILGLRPALGRVSIGASCFLDSSSGYCAPPRERRIGYVPQDVLLFPHLSVQANLELGKHYRNAGKPAPSLQQVASLLEIEGLLGRPVTRLSGGEKRRVAVARALCSGPEVLALDEPLSGLDVPRRRRLLATLIRTLEHLEIPALLVTHDPTEIVSACDQVIIVDQGRVVDQGEPWETLTRSAFEVLKHQFENTLHAKVARHEPDGTRALVQVMGGSVELLVPKVDTAVGASLLLTVPARDIIVATRIPGPLSARNVVPARALSVHEAEGHVLLRVALGGEESAAAPVVSSLLSVEMTRGAIRDLELEVGSIAYLIIKTQSICAAEL